MNAQLTDAEIDRILADAPAPVLDSILDDVLAPEGWRLEPLERAHGLWTCLARGPQHQRFHIDALCHSRTQALRSAVDKIRRINGGTGTAAQEIVGRNRVSTAIHREGFQYRVVLSCGWNRSVREDLGLYDSPEQAGEAAQARAEELGRDEAKDGERWDGQS